MPSEIPALDREFDNEKRRQIVLAEFQLRMAINGLRDNVLQTDPKPTHYVKTVDGRPSNRDEDVKLLP